MGKLLPDMYVSIDPLLWFLRLLTASPSGPRVRVGIKDPSNKQKGEPSAEGLQGCGKAHGNSHATRSGYHHHGTPYTGCKEGVTDANKDAKKNLLECVDCGDSNGGNGEQDCSYEQLDFSPACREKKKRLQAFRSEVSIIPSLKTLTAVHARRKSLEQ
ncbi:hypothetical protein RvY_04198 [Ramazzottius varieornatus]|uniref:Uncharacterized protein n=1 Tax=Ramazzottius varieornatus TaxID=947166 RepID=A0A1D1UQU3_RAMVA|nr:hypothetical protein RvY_04198 [Ramazzottius varieornatus]